MVALDRPGLHFVVEVDPAHHHEDDIDHDVVLEGLVDPDRVGLLRGEAGTLKRCQYIARVIGTHEEVDVMRPAWASHERGCQASEDQEWDSRPFHGLDGFAENPREDLV